MTTSEFNGTHQGGDLDCYRQYYDFTLNYLNDNMRLLNIGCGSMKYEQIVKRKFRNIKITSVDRDNYFEKESGRTDDFLVIDTEKPFNIGSFDCITCFEVIEHIDNTDELLQNCFNNLKEGGNLILSFPNLSSLYGRIELLLGYQPHILEISNESTLFGMGIFGRLNCSLPIFEKTIKPVHSIHHIRGFTYRGMKEFLEFKEFYLIKSVGFPFIFTKLPSLAPQVVMICRKDHCSKRDIISKNDEIK